MDAAGNVYIGDTGNGAVSGTIRKWTVANGTLTTLVSGLDNNQWALDADGSGNIYFSQGGQTIEKWTPLTGAVTTFLFGGNLNFPLGLAVDLSGNLYMANSQGHSIEELKHAFVDANPVEVTKTAGETALPAVLPTNVDLFGSFAPSTDQSWLSVRGVTNGVVELSFAETSSNRTGTVAVLGQYIQVTQCGPTFSLGVATMLVSPGAGSNSISLFAVPQIAKWTAKPNVSWLHLAFASQTGIGETNLVFAYDANQGETRTGTLIVAGQAITVTQAGANYVQATIVGDLIPTGLSGPWALALDKSDNVYIADYDAGGFEIWDSANDVLRVLVTNQLAAAGIAVDSKSNIYISSLEGGTLNEWAATNNSASVLVSSLLGPLAWPWMPVMTFTFLRFREMFIS